MISFLHAVFGINLPGGFIDSIVLQPPAPLVSQGCRRFRVAVANANRMCNKVECFFDGNCFRMPHGDVAVTGVCRGFCRADSGQTNVHESISQFSFNAFESLYAFDGSRSGAAMKKDSSNCELATPWSVETSVEGCPGPGKVRIDVV